MTCCSSRSVFVLSSLGSDYSCTPSTPSTPSTIMTTELDWAETGYISLSLTTIPGSGCTKIDWPWPWPSLAHCFHSILATLKLSCLYPAQSDLHLPLLLSNVCDWLLRSPAHQTCLLIGWAACPEEITLVVLTWTMQPTQWTVRECWSDQLGWSLVGPGAPVFSLQESNIITNSFVFIIIISLYHHAPLRHAIVVPRISKH